MSIESKEEIYKITPLNIAIVTVVTWLLFIWAFATRIASGPYYWTTCGLWIPYIWLLLIVHLLRKVNITISKTVFITISMMIWTFTGYWWYLAGMPEVNFTNTVTNFLFAAITPVHPEGAAEILSGVVPSWLYPQDLNTAQALYYGGPIDWGVLSGPIVAWSLLLISVILMGLPAAFLMLGPLFWEEERLIFPQVVPFNYAVVETYEQRLFSFKTTRQKTFWVFFIIGLIIGLPAVLVLMIPGLPAVLEVGLRGYPLEIDYLLEGTVLEGARVSTCLVLWGIAIFALLPSDLTFTTVVSYIIFNIFLIPAFIRGGIVAPGVDPSTSMPFPWDVWSYAGGCIGLGIYFLWRLRHRLVRALRSFSEDSKVEGISLRLGTLMYIIGAIMFIGIWSAAGANPFMMILYLIITTLIQIGGTYVYSTVGQDPWGTCFHEQTPMWLTPIGAAMGLWSATTPNIGNPTMTIFALANVQNGWCTGIWGDNSLIGMGMFAQSYATCKGTNANVRAVFTYATIALITLMPIAILFSTWVTSHMGIANTPLSTMEPNNWEIGIALDSGVRSPPTYGTLNYAEFAGWTVFGAVLIIILMWMRATFPWFRIHPFGFILGVHGAWWIGLWNPLIGLLIRLVIFRVLGAKRGYELLVTVISGLAIGMGALYLLMGLIITVNTVIPNYLTLWK